MMSIDVNGPAARENAPLPDEALRVIGVLEQDGHGAYAVGGCVRDMLRGVIPKDFDIATSAPPDRVKTLFSRTADTGIAHGTVTVLIGGQAFEVTTYRTDGEYLDGRRPSRVAFSAKIEDDLSRRDFTMNAVAYNPRTGFVDPHGGIADINGKLIKCVGIAEKRFGEDALRMMRAVRFASRLGFEIESDTLGAIKKLSHKLRCVSAERIRDELIGTLTGDYPGALVMLFETGLLAETLGGRAYGGDIYECARMLAIAPKETPAALALFFGWAGGEAKKLMRALRIDNKTIGEAARYIEFLPDKISRNPYDIKKALRGFPEKNFFTLLELKKIAFPGDKTELDEIKRAAEKIIKDGECFDLAGLAIKGDELINIGIMEGKPVGEALEALLEAATRDPRLNEKTRLVEMAETIKMNMD